MLRRADHLNHLILHLVVTANLWSADRSLQKGTGLVTGVNLIINIVIARASVEGLVVVPNTLAFIALWINLILEFIVVHLVLFGQRSGPSLALGPIAEGLR